MKIYAYQNPTCWVHWGTSGEKSFFFQLTRLILQSAGAPGPEFPNISNPYAFAAFTSMVCVIGFVIMFATGPGEWYFN